MFRSISCILLCMLTCAVFAEDATKRPWLGITLDTTGEFDARVVVKEVKAGSTAASMGIKAKDIITDFNSDKNSWRINGVDDLQSALKQHAANDKIRIGVERDGNNLTFEGTLQVKPSAKAALSANESLKKDIAALGDLRKNSNSTGALALSLHGLSKTLEQLPEKIEEAAKEFKEVYPDGEFVIKVEISISSKKSDDSETKPKAGEEADKQEQTKEDAEDGEEQADQESEAEKTETETKAEETE